MRMEEIMIDIEESLSSGDFKAVDKKITKHFGHLSDLDASLKISEMFLSHYTNFKSAYYSKLLETIIRNRPALAQVSYPENFLFKLCVITGSKDLYECFIEEAVEPFLKGKNGDKKDEYYYSVYLTALNLTDSIFPQYTQQIKGLHYDGAFSSLEDNENVVLTNREDYEIMEGVIANYNQIVGRRDIVNDLEKRSSSEE